MCQTRTLADRLDERAHRFCRTFGFTFDLLLLYRSTSLLGILGLTYQSVSGVLHPAFQTIFSSASLRKVASLSVSYVSALYRVMAM